VGSSITWRGWAILLVALTVGQAVLPAMAEAPPESGIWYIDGDVSLQNGTFYINGSVVVNSTGSLTVRDSILVCNGSYTEIWIRGRLTMTNATLESSQGAYGQAYLEVDGGTASLDRCSLANIRFFVSNWGQADLTSCNISGPSGIISSNEHYYTGCDLVINNCTFTDTGAECIHCFGGRLSVLGSRFFRTPSDAVASLALEGTPGPVFDGAVVSNNSFLGPGIGISQDYYGFSGTSAAIFSQDSGQTNHEVRDNIFAGYDCGLYLSYYATRREISDNSFVGCEYAVQSVDGSKGSFYTGNEVEGGRVGMQFETGSPTVSNNTISNCTGIGIYLYSSSPSTYSPVVSGNRIRGCKTGAFITNLLGDLSYNNISDCPVNGIYSYNAWDYRDCIIQNNTLSNCGFGGEGSSYFPAAISVAAQDNARALVAGNRISDNPGVGIRAEGYVRVENNTVEGAGTGIECVNYWGKTDVIVRNRLSGGQTGILIRGIAYVRENDISDVLTGISCELEGYSANLDLLSNAIHADDRGIVVRNLVGAVRKGTLAGNVIAAGIDGILVDSVQAEIKGNDFGGTAGVCVHAIGEEPVLDSNSFGTRCFGQLLQEWYLVVRALENPDPYNSTLWTNTDRYTVRIRNDTGLLVFSGGSGGSTSLSVNLTGYNVDRLGYRTNFTRYNVVVMKPHIGIGNVPATLFENAIANVQLFPRPDLAVQDIGLPGGRPLPGQSVSVEVTVVHDTTYDTFFTYLGAVNVALRDNGLPIGEKQIARLEPNQTATLKFGWSVSGGLHDLTAIVDPDLRIPESFEDNNEYSLMVAVNEPPVPVLTVSDLNPAAGRTVAFSSKGSTDDTGVARSLFDFGDGTVSGWTEDSTVLHVYAMPGIFESRLMVADAENVTSDWSLAEYVTVTEGFLEVSLISNSTFTDTLVPVLFQASPGSSSVAQHSFAWDFGDGTSEMGPGQQQVHTYTRMGKFTVTVTVTDSLGRTGAATVQVTVRNRPPNAMLAFSPAEPSVLSPVQFRSLSGDPDGVIGRWLWDLGDGNQSGNPAPRHLYLQKGNYTVTLSVQDDSGAWSAAAVTQLTVKNIPPAARATLSAVTVRAGETVRLESGLTEDPDDDLRSLDFCWSAPDGWSSTGPNATRRYQTPGRYRLTLTVTDGSGASSQDTVTIQVVPAVDSGDFQFKTLATGLSITAVAIFLVALFIFGKDRMGNAPAKTRSRPLVTRGGGGKTKRPTEPPAASRANRK